MKAYFKFGLALACFLVGFQLNGRATGLPADTLNAPDTVSVGVYITSVHDVDFKEKQYAINLWLWLKYKNPAFDFQKNLEVPMAKTFEKSYSTIDTHHLPPHETPVHHERQLENRPFPFRPAETPVLN
jgi:hypothetical protein